LMMIDLTWSFLGVAVGDVIATAPAATKARISPNLF
jgi:hypothetical protein